MNWHVFNLFDRYFLFDTPSNSLFSIDRPAFLLLREKEVSGGRQSAPGDEELSTAVRREVEKELKALQEQGFLLDEDPFLKKPVFKLRPDLKALCLHLAHDCQLRCVYCFAGGGVFGGDRSIMSPPVGKAALEFLLAGSGKIRHLEVDFFGGEPLLNRELLYDLVDYGEELVRPAGKKIHFTLTTNTLNLDREMLEFLRRRRMGIVLSMDGRPEINDRMRGRGTHDRIMPRILEVIKDFPELHYYVRGTYTRYNLDFTEDARHLYRLGVRSLSLEPVTGGAETSYALRAEDYPRIAEEYERLAAFWWDCYRRQDPFVFFHFQVDLEKGPCLPKRLLGCGAGFDYLAVTPQGDLYPCHQFVGEEAFRLGDVFQGITRPEIRAAFAGARFYRKEGCPECWARYYCSGGCHANAFFARGSILKPDRPGCALLKKRLECALGLKALQVEAEQGEAAAQLISTS